MTYCAAPGHAPDFVVVVADRTPLSDSSSASSGTHPGTCSLRPPFNTTLLALGRAAYDGRMAKSSGTGMPRPVRWSVWLGLGVLLGLLLGFAFGLAKPRVRT
jgi:hypothetical protein